MGQNCIAATKNASEDHEIDNFDAHFVTFLQTFFSDVMKQKEFTQSI
jgi:hypothetical protein